MSSSIPCRHGHPSLKACPLGCRAARKVEQKRAWRQAHQSREAERRRRCSERHRVDSARHRARVREAAQDGHTLSQLEARMAMTAGLCWICLKPHFGKYERDHVKPLAKGGAHVLSNLRPAHKSCNSSKKDRWPFDPTPYRKAKP